MTFYNPQCFCLILEQQRETPQSLSKCYLLKEFEANYLTLKYFLKKHKE